MNGYFATLGMKAIGSAFAIRIRREPLYGSPHFEDRINPDRDFSDTASTHDDIDGVQSVPTAAVEEHKPAAIVFQPAEARLGKGRSDFAPEAEHKPDSHPAPAMAIQIRELQQRLESQADASSRTVDGSAPHAGGRKRRQVLSAADDMQPIMTPDRGDSDATRPPAVHAERDSLQRLDFKNVDQDSRRSVTKRDLRTIPVDAAARRPGDAPAGAARPPHATETHLAKSIAVDSPRDASIATHRSDGDLHAQLESAVANSLPSNVGPDTKSETATGATPNIDADAGKPGPTTKSREGSASHRPLEIGAHLSAIRDESSGSRRPNALAAAAAKPGEKPPSAAAQVETGAHLSAIHDEPSGSRHPNALALAAAKPGEKPPSAAAQVEIGAHFSAIRDEPSGSRRPNALAVTAAQPGEKSSSAAAQARETHLQTVERPAAGRTRGNPDDTPAAVQVSIGRIEIREQRPAAVAPARRAQPPRMDLKEYLNRRFRGGAP
jgi:hypothetical protein